MSKQSKVRRFHWQDEARTLIVKESAKICVEKGRVPTSEEYNQIAELVQAAFPDHPLPESGTIDGRLISSQVYSIKDRYQEKRLKKNLPKDFVEAVAQIAEAFQSRPKKSKTSQKKEKKEMRRESGKNYVAMRAKSPGGAAAEAISGIASSLSSFKDVMLLTSISSNPALQGNPDVLMLQQRLIAKLAAEEEQAAPQPEREEEMEVPPNLVPPEHVEAEEDLEEPVEVEEDVHQVDRAVEDEREASADDVSVASPKSHKNRQRAAKDAERRAKKLRLEDFE